ncbi:MAG: malto-oligosyltrehalose synthase, partial [Gemmatimonadales bacterium]
PRLAALAEELAALSPARAAEAVADERDARRRALLDALAQLCDAEPAMAGAVDEAVAAVDRDVERLDELLRRQHYRLAYWRTAGEELDYRRFFNIETLVGVRQEQPDVFDATHRLVLQLVADGTVHGLRIDHVDGLRDPRGYLDRLAGRSGGAYTVVEKILEAGEPLPDAWPVAGTTGYDFAARVANLFVDTHHEAEMTDTYASLTGEEASFPTVALAAKRQVMDEELATEVARVTALLAAVTDRHRRHRDHTRRVLRETLRELVAHFPVYRTYVRPGRPSTEVEHAHVAAAVRAAGAARTDLDPELLAFVGQLALGGHQGVREAEFVWRFQQLTAPVMAKGVEDTAFYRYHRLISLNEVGGDPATFGRPVARFHEDSAASSSARA